MTRPRFEGCQRWRGGRAAYRPAGETIDPARYDVAAIAEAAAKSFVLEHHYSGSYPAARHRVGLFRNAPGRGTELVGAAVFSVPVNPNAGRKYAGLDASAVVELGRFVLLDDVPANGETFFLSRALASAAAALPEVRAVLSYSDPLPRLGRAGEIVMPGHCGTIYQAHSGGAYLGRATPRTLVVGLDGRVVSERALSKLRRDERGAAYAYRTLQDAGAPPRRPEEPGADYVRRALCDGPFRRVRHSGNHVYLFPNGDAGARRRLRKRLGPGKPYPKSADPLATAPDLSAHLPCASAAKLDPA